MLQDPIKKVLIIGGGTAGWMTAAAFAKFFNKVDCEITLIESEEIGTVGVGEATLPHLRYFNQTLGIDENEFLRATNGTYKLGIEFSDWGDRGTAYIHPFGEFGYSIDGIEFHQFYNALKLKKLFNISISEFSLPVVAAYQGKFDYPAEDGRSILSTFSYAFHIDASLYARFLRKFSEERRVNRIEGKIVDVVVSGGLNIQEVILENGEVFQADFYIDCTGGRALLIGEALNVPFDEWKHWLPCDRAIAVPTSSVSEPIPYTKARALQAGWQWRIPLQHRVGNGHVYSSGFLDDTRAMESLMNNLEGEPLAEPKLIKFRVGHRRLNWSGNCVAIGLSAGFLEPLESTSIHLIQSAITKLLELFPTKKIENALRDEFNAEMRRKFHSVRDFLILHYHLTRRTDTEFWNYCRTMNIPDDLGFRMDMYSKRGQVLYSEGDLFLEPSWLAVYFGQSLSAEGFDPRIEAYPMDEAERQFARLKQLINQAVQHMPFHAQSIKRSCCGDDSLYPRASQNLYGRK